MELQSLLTGLLTAVLAFAVKTGLGWAYLWRKRGRGRRLWPSLGVLGLYALVFGLILLLVENVDLIANYRTLEPLWRGGQALHWLMALLLFVWGLLLMRSRRDQDRGAEDLSTRETVLGLGPEDPPAGGEEGDRGSSGYLALIVPCPVCLSVVTMSLACLVIYFPGQAAMGTALLFLGFAAVALASGLLLIFGVLGRGENLERSLGLAMATAASYFMLSALVLPQFGGIDRVYRLASYSRDETSRHPGGLWLLLAVLALLAAGFLLERRRRAGERGSPRPAPSRIPGHLAGGSAGDEP